MKERTTPEAAALSFGVGKLRRHLFICVGGDCAPLEQGQATWDYVKRRMRADPSPWFILKAPGIETSRRKTPSPSSRSM